MMTDTSPMLFKWPESPYPGLRPFQVTENFDESLIFYGREAQKEHILRALGSLHFITVLGPSGCGKSSLIKAGVVPALEAGFLRSAGHRWVGTEMRPGSQPVKELAAAFVRLVAGRGGDRRQTGDDIEKLLWIDRSGLWLTMDCFWPGVTPSPSLGPQSAPANLLLVIDQFEEIFRPQIENQRDVEHLVELLIHFFEKPHPNLYIILTMRTGYIGRLASFAGFAEVLNTSQFLVPVLRPGELRSAITGPVKDYHGEVEPRLVDAIISDVGGGIDYDPDHLPLMQHSLRWLWNQAWPQTGAAEPPHPDRDPPRERILLSLLDYERHGRLKGILNHHADTILRQVSSGDGEGVLRRMTEIMFRRLVERDVEGRYGRSPSAVAEVSQLAGCEPSELADAIAPFAAPDASFLEVRPPEVTKDALLDISHESLIRQWRQLRMWADDEAAKVGAFRDLVVDAQTWVNRQRSPSFLRTRGKFETMQQWWREASPSKEWAKRYRFAQNGPETLADHFDLVDEFRTMSVKADEEFHAQEQRLRDAETEAARAKQFEAEARAERERALREKEEARRAQARAAQLEARSQVEREHALRLEEERKRAEARAEAEAAEARAARYRQHLLMGGLAASALIVIGGGFLVWNLITAYRGLNTAYQVLEAQMELGKIQDEVSIVQSGMNALTGRIVYPEAVWTEARDAASRAEASRVAVAKLAEAGEYQKRIDALETEAGAIRGRVVASGLERAEGYDLIRAQIEHALGGVVNVRAARDLALNQARGTLRTAQRFLPKRLAFSRSLEGTPTALHVSERAGLVAAATTSPDGPQIALWALPAAPREPDMVERPPTIFSREDIGRSERRVEKVIVSPDGGLLAAATWAPNPSKELPAWTVIVWRLGSAPGQSGQVLAYVEDEDFLDFAFSDDADRLAVVGEDGLFRVLDLTGRRGIEYMTAPHLSPQWRRLWPEPNVQQWFAPTIAWIDGQFCAVRFQTAVTTKFLELVPLADGGPGSPPTGLSPTAKPCPGGDEATWFPWLPPQRSQPVQLDLVPETGLLWSVANDNSLRRWSLNTPRNPYAVLVVTGSVTSAFTADTQAQAGEGATQGPVPIELDRDGQTLFTLTDNRRLLTVTNIPDDRVRWAAPRELQRERVRVDSQSVPRGEFAFRDALQSFQPLQAGNLVVTLSSGGNTSSSDQTLLTMWDLGAPTTTTDAALIEDACARIVPAAPPTADVAPCAR
jgi:hypothetical protein